MADDLERYMLASNRTSFFLGAPAEWIRARGHHSNLQLNWASDSSFLGTYMGLVSGGKEAEMNPTSSFMGKCTTVLIGVVLSWITMTNRDAQLLAKRLFGGTSPTLSVTGISDAVTTLGANVELAEQSLDSRLERTETEEMEEISDMLRELGATYLRVEKLAKSGETWFRVRCDIDRGPNQVKCCLESTRDSVVAAMKDVLRAADPEI